MALTVAIKFIRVPKPPTDIYNCKITPLIRGAPRTCTAHRHQTQYKTEFKGREVVPRPHSDRVRTGRRRGRY